MRSLLVFLLILVHFGCAARGFDRGALRHEMRQDLPTEVTDSDIQKALELKPQMKFPFRLAVYLKSEGRGLAGASSPQLRYRNHLRWRWEGEDKDSLLSIAEKLKAEGVITDMFILPPSRVSQHDLRGIRVAAAEHGADAVLVVDGNEDVDRYQNYFGFLYVTIVGAWLVPATHADALFVMDGAMWDVRNKYLYLSVEAEGMASKLGPVMVLEDKDAIAEAKKQAVGAFVPELAKRLKAIAGK